MGKMNRRQFLAGAGAFLGLSASLQAKITNFSPALPPQQPSDAPTPLPFVPGSWTFVVLPDTQHYAECYAGLLNLQTQWIVDNIKKYNIVYVLTLGDLTNHNNELQWDRVSRAFGRLDGVVPYTIVLGNHDHGLNGNAKTRDTLADDYFPLSRFAGWPTFGGVMENGHIENNFHLFKAGSGDWLILNLEWGPRDETLEWADRILEKYSSRRAIIATHAYLYSDSMRYDWQTKGQEQKWNPHNYGTAGGVNDGEQIWQKLVKKHANVAMVINGHVLNDGLGFLVSKADNGNSVNQMLVNFQDPIHPLGGEAWLRLLEFLPDGKSVQAKTYSPLYEVYKTDPDNQFVIKLDL
jgi:hypothetical protein